MIAEGLMLMFVGMLVVFCFLVLLVVVMSVSAKFFDYFSDYFPDPPAPNLKTVFGQDQTEIAAVLAAIHHHQNS